MEEDNTREWWAEAWDLPHVRHAPTHAAAGPEKRAWSDGRYVTQIYLF